MAATYHHARRLYIGTTAERAAVVLDVDGMGTEYWDTDVSALYIWDGTAWVSGFAALPHDILSATHGDTTPAAAVRGDLMTGQGVAPLWARLPIGAATFILRSDGVDPSWVDPSLHVPLPPVAEGDIIYAGPVPSWTRLARGAAGTVLQMGAFQIPGWVAATNIPVAPGGVGHCLISNGVPAWESTATPVWTGLHTFNAGLAIAAGQGITMPDAGWIGIAGNELLTVNAAGNFTFSGVTSVVVPDGCWVGADAACSWMYDLTQGFVTTLDKVAVGLRSPLAPFHVYDTAAAHEVFIEKMQNTAGWGPTITYRRRRVAGNVANGDYLGGFEYQGYHTGAYVMGAMIKVEVDGAPGAGSMPSRMILGTSDGTFAWATERVRIDNVGHVGINTLGAIAASAILELSSTTGALLLTRMTTAQRNALAPVDGMVIYNTTTGVLEAREGGAWVNL